MKGEKKAQKVGLALKCHGITLVVFSRNVNKKWLDAGGCPLFTFASETVT